MKKTPLKNMLPSERLIFENARQIEDQILMNYQGERSHSVYVSDAEGNTILYAPFLQLLRVGPDSELMEDGLFAYFGDDDADPKNLLSDVLAIVDVAYLDENPNHDDFVFKITPDSAITARNMKRWYHALDELTKKEEAEQTRQNIIKEKAKLEAKILKLQKRLMTLETAEELNGL